MRTGSLASSSMMSVSRLATSVFSHFKAPVARSSATSEPTLALLIQRPQLIGPFPHLLRIWSSINSAQTSPCAASMMGVSTRKPLRANDQSGFPSIVQARRLPSPLATTVFPLTRTQWLSPCMPCSLFGGFPSSCSSRRNGLISLPG